MKALGSESMDDRVGMSCQIGNSGLLRDPLACSKRSTGYFRRQ